MGWLDRGRTHDHSAPERTAHGTPPEPVGRSSASPTPTQLTNLNFERFLQTHHRAVIDVWAPWCVPCRAFAPVFAEVAREMGDRVGFGRLHADHSPTLVTRLGVRSIPTLLFYRDGARVRTHVGVLSAGDLRERIRKVFRDLG